MKILIGALALATVLAQARPARQDNAPKVGDAAPNFKARKLEDKDKTVELKKFVEETKKPVVLLFGSFT